MALAAAALPLIGATLGGIQGFRQSGGDLGAAALGAGIGATGGYYLPAGVRMAGQALMGLPGVSSAVSAASPKAFQALQGLKAVQGGAGLKGAMEAAKAAGSYATHPLAQQLGKGAYSEDRLHYPVWPVEQQTCFPHRSALQLEESVKSASKV
jgi:hypothetical protein